MFDWLGPLNAGGKSRGWDSLPMPTEQKSAPDFVPADANGTVVILNRLVQTPAPYDARRGGDGNSAVYACLQLIATALQEAPFRVYRVTPDEYVEAPPSPLSDLLARPNPAMTLRTMVAYLSTSLHVDGNAYWRKLRAGDPETGNVVELWPIAPSRIEPVTRNGSSDFISFYRYTSGGGRPEEISTANIVHFRYGLDDADHRKGSSPLRRLLREISSDEQATRYADRLLANLAVAGLALTWDKDANAGKHLSQAEADELKVRVGAAYGGDNVGAVAVLSPGATLSQLGFSPEQMDLRVLHQVPEERIAAVLGVPAAVVGLGAGLEHSIYNNVKQAEEHFTERKLAPLWNDIGDVLTLSLVPDFTSDRTVRIEADTSDVRALQDDEDALATRLQTLVAAGILTADEARAEIGYDALPHSTPHSTRSLAQGRSGQARRLVMLDSARPSTGAPVRVGSTKSADDVAPGIAGLRDEAEPEWLVELRRWLSGVERRVVRRLRAGGDTAGDLVPDIETEILAEVERPLQLGLLADVADIVRAELAVGFVIDDPATRRYLMEAGGNISGITETTRRAVADALVEGQQAGEGIPELARRLRALPAFGDARARLVARTELGLASNVSALASYRASGVVVGVRVLDGDSDAACAAMDGRAFTLDQAPAALEHPACVRAFAPLVDAADLEATG